MDTKGSSNLTNLSKTGCKSVIFTMWNPLETAIIHTEKRHRVKNPIYQVILGEKIVTCEGKSLNKEGWESICLPYNNERIIVLVAKSRKGNELGRYTFDLKYIRNCHSYFEGKVELSKNSLVVGTADIRVNFSRKEVKKCVNRKGLFRFCTGANTVDLKQDILKVPYTGAFSTCINTQELVMEDQYNHSHPAFKTVNAQCSKSSSSSSSSSLSCTTNLEVSKSQSVDEAPAKKTSSSSSSKSSSKEDNQNLKEPTSSSDSSKIMSTQKKPTSISKSSSSSSSSTVEAKQAPPPPPVLSSSTSSSDDTSSSTDNIIRPAPQAVKSNSTRIRRSQSNASTCSGRRRRADRTGDSKSNVSKVSTCSGRRKKTENKTESTAIPAPPQKRVSRMSSCSSKRSRNSSAAPGMKPIRTVSSCSSRRGK